jgi:hypothetical protein
MSLGTEEILNLNGGHFSSRVSKRRPSCMFVIIHSLIGENALVISSDKSLLQPLTQDKLSLNKVGCLAQKRCVQMRVVAVIGKNNLL